jgi:hypothetical protein
MNFQKYEIFRNNQLNIFQDLNRFNFYLLASPHPLNPPLQFGEGDLGGEGLGLNKTVQA